MDFLLQKQLSKLSLIPRAGSDSAQHIPLQLHQSIHRKQSLWASLFGSIVIDGVVVQWRQSWARLSPGFWNCLQEDAKRTLSWALSPQAQCA